MDQEIAQPVADTEVPKPIYGSQEWVDAVFGLNPDDEIKLKKKAAIRQVMILSAKTILDNSPFKCSDQLSALRNLRTALSNAFTAIELDGLV